MNWIKLIFVNFTIFLIIVFSIEMGAGVSRTLIGKEFLPLLAKSSFLPEWFDPNHPCVRMKTDVLLDHVPDHRDECVVKDGVVEREYVLYKYATMDKPKILTLGGSTTSGFYQHISSGETYPKILAEMTSESHFLLNGGVGGYSSLQEFFKFSRDGSRLNGLDIVISLNGINDIPGYQGSEVSREHRYPFMTYTQYSMNQSQAWIDQRIADSIFEKLLPNMHSLFLHLNAQQIKAEHEDSNGNSTFNAVDAADRWETNIRRINALVNSQNAKYYSFLQPTMGLFGVQSEPTEESSDALIFSTLDAIHVTDLRAFYTELIDRCSQLDFCFDITNVAPPTGDNYNDPRHHNRNGNAIIDLQDYQ